MRVTTWDTFVKNIKAGNYANSLTYNHESYNYNNLYMSEDSNVNVDGEYNDDTAQIGVTNEEYNQLLSRFNDAYDTSMLVRGIRSVVMSNTIFTPLNSNNLNDNINDARKMLLQDALEMVGKHAMVDGKYTVLNVESYDNQFKFTDRITNEIKDIRTISYDEFVRESNNINTVDGPLKLTQYINAKLLNGLQTSSTKANVVQREAADHINRVLDIVFQGRNLISQQQIQIVDSSRKGIEESSSPSLRLILSSIPVLVHEIEMNRDSRTGKGTGYKVNWSKRKVMGAQSLISEKTLAFAGTLLNNVADDIYGQSMENILSTISDVLQKEALSMLIDKSSPFANILSHEYLSLAAFFYQDVNSMWNKYKNGDERVKRAVSNLVTAFLGNYVNLAETKYAKLGWQYLGELNVNDMAVLKKVMTNKIRTVTLDSTGFLRSNVVKLYSENPILKVHVKEGKILGLQVQADTGLRTLMEFDGGKFVFTEYAQTPMGISKIQSFFKSINVVMGYDAIKMLVTEPEAIGRKLDRGKMANLDDTRFITNIIGGMMLSMNLGSIQQTMIDYVSSQSTANEFDIDYIYKIAGSLYYSDMYEKSFDEKIDHFKEVIRKMVLEDTSISDNKVRAALMDKYMTMLERYRHTAKAYHRLIGMFYGLRNINSVEENAIIQEDFFEEVDEADETDDTINTPHKPKQKRILTSPLDWQIAYPALAKASQLTGSKSLSVHTKGKNIHTAHPDSSMGQGIRLVKLAKRTPNYNNQYNPLATNKKGFILRGYVQIVEYTRGFKSTDDFEFGDYFIALFDTILKGAKSGNLTMPAFARGDDNKLSYFNFGENPLAFTIQKLVDKKRFKKESDTAQDKRKDKTSLRYEYKKVYNLIADVFRTDHNQHLTAVEGFVEAMKNYIAENVNVLPVEMYSTIIKRTAALETEVNKTRANPLIDDGIRNYKFYDVLRNIFDVLTTLNTINTIPELANSHLTPELLNNYGLRKNFHIKMKDGKIDFGNALSFRTEVTSETDGESLVISSRKEDAISGKYIYNERVAQERGEENYVKRFFDYNIDEVLKKDEAEFNDTRINAFDPNRKTVADEVYEILDTMFGFETKLFANEVAKIEANNKIPNNVSTVIGSRHKEKGMMYTSDGEYNHLFTLIYMNYFGINRHMIDYLGGTSFNFNNFYEQSTRLKSLNTQGPTAVPSERGLAKSFKVAILNDQMTEEVEVKLLDLETGELKTEKVVVMATDGSSQIPAYAAHYSHISFAEQFAINTSQTEKSIITRGGTNPLLIKHAGTRIDGQTVSLNPNLRYLEYKALSNVNPDIAQQFLVDYDTYLELYSNDEEIISPVERAFNQASKNSIKNLDNYFRSNPEAKKNIIGMYSSPSSVKIFTGSTNNFSFDQTEHFMDTEKGLLTITAPTNSYKMIFNADTDIENSEGEKLFKQLFHLVKGITSPALSAKMEAAMVNIVEGGLRTLKIDNEGNISAENIEKFIDKSIRTASSAMTNVGTPTVAASLLTAAINNKQLINLPQISYSLNSAIRKQLNKHTSAVKFNGTSYNQVMTLSSVYDVEVLRDGGNIKQTVTAEGLRRLQKVFEVNVIAERELNTFSNDTKGYRQGEVIAGTTNMYKFNITRGMSLAELSLINVSYDGKEVLAHIEEIQGNGMLKIGETFIDLNKEGVTITGTLLDINKGKNALKLISDFKASLEIILVRKPTTLPNAGGVYRVVDFIFDTNSIFYNAKKNAWDDSDNDIDKLYSYEYDLSSEGVAKDKNNLLSLVKEGYAEMGKAGNLNISISTEILDGLIKKGFIAPAGSLLSSLSSVRSNRIGLEAVARAAKMQIAISNIIALGKVPSKGEKIYNAEYNGPFNNVSTLLQEIKNGKLDIKELIVNAVILQAAVDTGKSDKLGHLGITIDSLPEIASMLWSGQSFSDIVEFMKNPLVKSIYSSITSAKEITGKNNTKSLFLVALESLKKAGISTEQITEYLNDPVKMQELREVYNNYRTTESEKFALIDNIKKNEGKLQRASKDIDEQNLQLTISELESKVKTLSFLQAKAEQYVLLELLSHSMLGKVINDVSFILDLADGTQSKDHMINNVLFNVESAFGIPFSELNIGNMESHTETFNEESIQRKVDYQLENNHFIKQSTLQDQAYYEFFLKEQYSLFNLANYITESPMLKAYLKLYKGHNQIMDSKLMDSNKVTDGIKKTIKAMGYGTNLSSFSYYEAKAVVHNKLLSEALVKYIYTKPYFLKDGAIRIDMTIPHMTEQGLTDDGLSRGFENIDLNTFVGREKYVKRFANYAMGFNGLMEIYFDTLEQGGSTAQIESYINAYYGIKAHDLVDMVNSMRKYKGETLFDNLEARGRSEHDTLLTIRDADQLKRDEVKFGKLKAMFNSLPPKMKDMLSIYETLINGSIVKASSIYDIMGVEFLSDLSQYFNEQLIDEMLASEHVLINDMAVVNDMALSAKDSISKELLEHYIKDVNENGLKDDEGKYTFMKVYLSEHLNGKKVGVKKIYVSDFENALNQINKVDAEVTWGDIGMHMFPGATKNSLPYFNNKSSVTIAMPILSLTEKNINDLIEFRRTTIQFPRGHKLGVDKRRYQSAKVNVSYSTNGTGLLITPVVIHETAVVFEVTGEDQTFLSNVPTQERRPEGLRTVDLGTAKTRLTELSDILKQTHIRHEATGNYIDGKGTVKISISKYSKKFGSITESDHLKSRQAAGQVADRMAKVIIENQFSGDMIQDRSNGKLFLDLYNEHYGSLPKKLQILNRFSPEQIMEIGKAYYMDLAHKAGMSQVNNMIFGEGRWHQKSIIHDLRMEFVLGEAIKGKKQLPMMGELDTLILYRLNNKINTGTIIDFKVTSPSTYVDTEGRTWDSDFHDQTSLYAKGLEAQGIKIQQTIVMAIPGFDVWYETRSPYLKDGRVEFRKNFEDAGRFRITVKKASDIESYLVEQNQKITKLAEQFSQEKEVEIKFEEYVEQNLIKIACE